MKLSEACRLGTTMIPTIYGPIFKRTLTGKVCGACRIGSIALAAGMRPARFPVHVQGEDSRAVHSYFHTHWPWISRVPDAENSMLFIFGIPSYIAYCHEIAKMTADEIAVVLEKLEAKYANNDPVVMDTTPNVAGDATQLMEVQ